MEQNRSVWYGFGNCDSHANYTISSIKNILFSDEFCNKYKKSIKDFVRERKLPFTHLVLAVLRLGKASIQRELDKFFQALGQMQKITAGALTHARKKLHPEVFIALNDTLVQNFYTYDSSIVKNGIQRILAVDGSRIDRNALQLINDLMNGFSIEWRNVT